MCLISDSIDYINDESIIQGIIKCILCYCRIWFVWY